MSYLISVFLYVLIQWLGYSYATIEEPSLATEDIWKKADRFACQCFCMTTNFRIDKNRIAHSTAIRFGFGVDAVPLVHEGSLEYWMSIYKKRQLAIYMDPRGSQVLQSFQVAFVVDAPPTNSKRAREKVLNMLSHGQYDYVKRQYEATKDPIYFDRISEIQHALGVSLEESSRAKKRFHILYDRHRYSSMRHKANVWRNKCHKVCHAVVRQNLQSFHYKPHYEFAFIKHPHEPFDEKSWISAEPIHEGEVGLSPSLIGRDGLEHERRKWISKIKKRYAPLFTGIMTGRHAFHSCSQLQSLTESIPDKSDWLELALGYDVTRDIKEIDPPGYERELRRIPRQAIGVEEQIFSRNVKESNVGSSISRKQPSTIPSLLDQKKWIDLIPEGAIRRRLLISKQQVMDWPAKAPTVLSHQITPQYRFRAIIQGSDAGYRITSFFSGVQSSKNRNLYEFLYVYMDAIEHEGLQISLENIILQHWTKSVLEEYTRKGSKVGKRKTTANDDEWDDVFRHVEGNEISEKSYENDGEDDLSGLILTESTSSKTASERSSLLQQEGSISTKSTGEVNSLSELETFQHSIQQIYIEYIGALFVACWHQASTTTTDPDNRLVFIIRPTKFTLQRSDESTVEVPVYSESIAAQFLGLKGRGIIRLYDGIKQPEFIQQMRMYRAREHKVIYRVLQDIFKINETLNYLSRNTCELDHKVTNLEIEKYCQSETISLYSDIDPSIVKGLDVILTGASLQQYIGQLLTKCYGRMLPSATILWHRGSPPVKYKSECKKTSSGRYEFVEKGPYEISTTIATTSPIQKSKKVMEQTILSHQR